MPSKLDALFDEHDTPVSALTREASLPRETEMFSEPCKKCAGSGSFYSYSGRLLGACHACKGKKVQTFKTSPEARQRAREGAEARHQRKIAEWRASFPDHARWLDNKYMSFSFAASLREALNKYGALTEGQTAAIEKCMLRDAQRIEEREARIAAAPSVSTAAIEAAFTKAGERAILRLDTFKLSVGAKGIYVKEGANYRGKIAGGKFHALACSPETSARVLAAVADPQQAAIAYGRKFGKCSICARTLTKGVSIERGIGPICAEKFGW